MPSLLENIALARFAYAPRAAQQNLEARTQNANLDMQFLRINKALFQNANKKISILKPILKGMIRKGAQNYIDRLKKILKTIQCLQIFPRLYCTDELY